MSKYKLIKKAYCLNLERIMEGFLCSEVVVHADSHNVAKSLLLFETAHEGHRVSRTGEDVTYLNIPVKRSPENDIYEFEGNHICFNKIQGILKERERRESLQTILDDATIAFCYIRKRGCYYRPNDAGYTEMQTRAGIYDKEGAVKRAISCEELTLVPVDMTKHNALLQAEIDEMKQRLIEA